MTIDELGEITDTRPVPIEIIQQYESILSPTLIEIWKEHGFCQFAHGAYQFVNPTEWQPVVDAWLAGTEYEQQLGGHFYALSRNACNELYIFHLETKSKLTIDPILGRITGSINDGDDEYDTAISRFTIALDQEDIDFFDFKNKPLLKRSIKKCGGLGWDEMYNFEPAYALIGDAALDIKYVNKANALVQMMVLRQMIDVPKSIIFNMDWVKEAARQPIQDE
ncbi:GAD-like domain-containing protein [Acinetobacter boissieri]|nr:GAD-like domain-containing protein [Acinetobacter boissieri]